MHISTIFTPKDVDTSELDASLEMLETITGKSDEDSKEYSKVRAGDLRDYVKLLDLFGVEDQVIVVLDSEFADFIKGGIQEMTENPA